MLHYLATHKKVAIGFVLGVIGMAILMTVLFESIKAAGAVIMIAVIGLATAWLWQAGDE